MSEILIKGMEMPKENDYLHLIIQNGKVHKAISCGYISTDELNVAEAVELPPHGDLIDRRKLWKDTEGLGEYCYDRDFISLCDAISEAPMVLEASK